MLSILSVGIIADRIIRLIDGDTTWWNLCSAIIIFAFCVKFYLNCRKQMGAEK